MIKALEPALGVSLLSILLYGCHQLSNQPNAPLESPLTPGLTQTITPLSSETMLTTVPTVQAEQRPSMVTPQPTDAIRSIANSTPGACLLVPITQPPWPDKTFMANEPDSEIDLHITSRPQLIDLETYRLQVTGQVNQPLSLSYDDLRCIPSVTDNPELICPGVFTDYATWTGVPIRYILELAGVQPGATKLTLVGADGYDVQLSLEIASAEENFLAYEVNGKPLPVEH